MSTVARVSGLLCLAGYLDQGEQDELLALVDRQPWCTDLKRRVQHYGYRYDYRRRTVDRDLHLGPLPPWAGALAERLHREGHAARPLDQVIVNEYLPGQGIAPHVDCVPCFGDTVLSLSLGSACVFTMSRADTGDRVPVLLAPGSLLIMRDAARYQWRHAIAARRTDVHRGRTVIRGRRVSLTFRSVLVRD